MKVLFDTNVVLDLLLDREPHAEAAADLFARVESGGTSGYFRKSPLPVYTPIEMLKLLQLREKSEA